MVNTDGFMILEDAHLLCDILAALEVMIAIWKNLRLNDGHQAVLYNKQNKTKKNTLLACSDALSLKDLCIMSKASLCTGGYLLADASVSG